MWNQIRNGKRGRLTHNQTVAGSIPAGPTTKKPVAQAAGFFVLPLQLPSETSFYRRRKVVLNDSRL